MAHAQVVLPVSQRAVPTFAQEVQKFAKLDQDITDAVKSERLEDLRRCCGATPPDSYEGRAPSKCEADVNLLRSEANIQHSGMQGRVQQYEKALKEAEDAVAARDAPACIAKLQAMQDGQMAVIKAENSKYRDLTNPEKIAAVSTEEFYKEHALDANEGAFEHKKKELYTTVEKTVHKAGQEMLKSSDDVEEHVQANRRSQDAIMKVKETMEHDFQSETEKAREVMAKITDIEKTVEEDGQALLAVLDRCEMDERIAMKAAEDAAARIDGDESTAKISDWQSLLICVARRETIALEKKQLQAQLTNFWEVKQRMQELAAAAWQDCLAWEKEATEQRASLQSRISSSHSQFETWCVELTQAAIHITQLATGYLKHIFKAIKDETEEWNQKVAAKMKEVQDVIGLGKGTGGDVSSKVVNLKKEQESLQKSLDKCKLKYARYKQTLDALEERLQSLRDLGFEIPDTGSISKLVKDAYAGVYRPVCYLAKKGTSASSAAHDRLTGTLMLHAPQSMEIMVKEMVERMWKERVTTLQEQIRAEEVARMMMARQRYETENQEAEAESPDEEQQQDASDQLSDGWSVIGDNASPPQASVGLKDVREACAGRAEAVACHPVQSEWEEETANQAAACGGDADEELVGAPDGDVEEGQAEENEAKEEAEQAEAGEEEEEEHAAEGAEEE